MTTPVRPASPATTARLIHASMVAGVVTFALVTHFVIRPQREPGTPLPPVVLNTMLGVALLSGAASIFLRGRVPQRSSTDSADRYWSTAFTAAMLMWVPLEAGALIAGVVYLLSGVKWALGALALNVLGLVWLNPVRIEQA